MDQIFRKLTRPMDARGLRGIFSRGKATYPGGAPNPKQLQLIRQAALERFKNGNRPNHR